MNKPTLYVISTCPKCHRVQSYLNQIGFEYDMIAIDLISREERSAIIDSLRRYNPSPSFPTLDLGDTILIGTTIDEINQVLERAR